MCTFFFFNDTATTEIYTLSLHDALPIWPWNAANRLGGYRHGAMLPVRAVNCQTRRESPIVRCDGGEPCCASPACCQQRTLDRKSTRLNSSHRYNSYAVFCLEKNRRPSTR